MGGWVGGVGVRGEFVGQAGVESDETRAHWARRPASAVGAGGRGGAGRRSTAHCAAPTHTNTQRTRGAHDRRDPLVDVVALGPCRAERGRVERDFRELLLDAPGAGRAPARLEQVGHRARVPAPARVLGQPRAPAQRRSPCVRPRTRAQRFKKRGQVCVCAGERQLRKRGRGVSAGSRWYAGS